MIQRLICVLVLLCAAGAAEPPSKDLGYIDSFSVAWGAFESACKNGDAPAMAKSSDERIIKWLDGDPLAKFLGADWKADSVTIKRKAILVPHGKYSAAAFLIVEVSEFGKASLHAMWWVFDGSQWRCLNLPFTYTFLPPRITLPHFAEPEPNHRHSPTRGAVRLRAIHPHPKPHPRPLRVADR